MVNVNVDAWIDINGWLSRLAAGGGVTIGAQGLVLFLLAEVVVSPGQVMLSPFVGPS